MASKSRKKPSKNMSSAVFNTATALSVAPTSQNKRSHSYIRSLRADFLFIILSPLLIMAVAYLSERAGMLVLLAFFAHTIGTAGHHLPGMLRAYGDKELFQQFKTRFIMAPILLLPLCIYFAFSEYKGLSALLLLWGTWHGMAQAYGFARIYDSKIGRVSKSIARMDLAVYLSWFLVGFVCSDNRIVDALEVFYQIGFPLFKSSFIIIGQNVLLAGALLISLFYMMHEIKLFRSGEKINWVKHALTISSCGFWCYTMITVKTAIVSLALFELFHDIQYLAIVWFFNQNRIAQNTNVGSFTKNLFGTKPYQLALYIGVVLVYGSFALLQYRVSSEIIAKIIVGFFVFSTILHFYFDGFIWKLRRASIAKSLDISSDLSEQRASHHTYKWVLGAVALLGLVILQGPGHPTQQRKDHISQHFFEIAPHNPKVLQDYADMLFQKGQHLKAVELYKRAEPFNPNNIALLESIAVILENLARHEEARTYYKKIIALDPRHENANLALIKLKSLIEFGVPLQFIDP